MTIELKEMRAAFDLFLQGSKHLHEYKKEYPDDNRATNVLHEAISMMEELAALLIERQISGAADEGASND